MLDEPENFRTKEESKLGVLEHILQPEMYPPCTRTPTTRCASTTTRRAADAKEGWDNIDLFGWLRHPMQLKVNSSAQTRSCSPLVLRPGPLHDLAQRSGMVGIQEWLSFYFKSPQHAPTLYPEHDLFIQQTKLKNTLRWLMGEDQITHLGMEYYRQPPLPISSEPARS